MIFMSMSFHHFSDPHRATQECRRVLREPGPALVRTAVRERSGAYPYVPFFPASVPMLEETLPDSTVIREAFEAAGFHLVASQLITQTIAPGWAAYAEKLAAGGDSVLARLRRQDLDDGLAALRRRATEQDDQAVCEPIDLFVFQ
jgi:SAM-dependent methyltransferase